ncbi:arginase family protein, partial [Aminipila sp.]
MQKKNNDVKDKKTWCGLNQPEMKEKDADVVVFGIPFDGGVSYRGGAAEAPEVLRANTKHSTPQTERLHFYNRLNIVDSGDFVGEDRDTLFTEV